MPFNDDALSTSPRSPLLAPPANVWEKLRRRKSREIIVDRRCSELDQTPCTSSPSYEECWCYRVLIVVPKLLGLLTKGRVPGGQFQLLLAMRQTVIVNAIGKNVDGILSVRVPSIRYHWETESTTKQQE